MKIKQFIIEPESKEHIIIPADSRILSVEAYTDRLIAVYVLPGKQENEKIRIHCIRSNKETEYNLDYFYYIGMVTLFKGLYKFFIFIDLKGER